MPNNAGAVKVVLSIDAANYSAALDKAKRQMNQFGESTKAAGHATVSQMQAASASIRLIEGGMTNNIRAVERFISTIPKAGAALQGLFPFVGGLAFAGLIAKIGKEAYDFMQKMREMPAGIKTAFGEMSLASQKSNDELQLVNDKLAASIAKLEHKPVNELAIAIDQDRVAADNLAEAAHRAFTEVDKLLKDKGISTFGSIFSGQQNTNAAAGTIRAFAQQIDDLTRQYQQAVRSGNTGVANDLKKQISDKRNAGISKMDEEIGKASVHEAGTGDANRANINLYRGYQDQLQLEQDRAAETEQNKALEARQKHDQDAKDAQDKANQAARDAAARMKQSMEDQLSAAQADHKVSVAEELGYWQSALAAVKNGSKPFLALKTEISQKIGHLSQEQRTQQEAAIAASAHEQERETQQFDAYSNRLKAAEDRQMDDIARYAEKKQQLLYQGDQIGNRNDNAFAEAQLNLQVSTGQISLLGAAQEQAALHAKAHADAIAELNQQLKDIKDDDNLDDSDKDLESRKVRNEISKANGSNQVQVMQDSAAISAQTGSGALQESMARFVQDSRDDAAQVREIWQSASQGINDNLADMLSGQKSHWSSFFQSIAKEGASIGLKRVEGGLLDALQKKQAPQSGSGETTQSASGAPSGVLGSIASVFGIGSQGKPDGTTGSPWNVNVLKMPASAGGGASGASSGIGGLLSSLGGAADGGSDGSGGGGAGSAIGTAVQLAAMFAGFASGGSVPGDKPIMVGEKGPEIFMPPRLGGSIIPNSKLRAPAPESANVTASTHALENQASSMRATLRIRSSGSSGGGDTHHYHNYAIDARGAHDPAAVEAAVNRGIKNATPHIMAATIAQQKNQQSRMPSSRR